VSKLGEGGMGEVYRATDTKLARDVALKFLPEGFGDDADRVARFEREARTLAALNHPNIAQIYGVEANALVMELVEGGTLDQVIGAPRQLKIDDALPIAKQIAEALEAAHEAGIIHRDLKPANIKVRPDGTVKVLDFGLAKAMDVGPSQTEGPYGRAGSSLANSPTLTARATQMGMILGTAAYMAPEQAKGRAVDRRADVWAFGVVLYEMLTGRRLFEAEDVSETLAAVLTRDVSLAALPPAIPARLRALLRDCLVRDPRQRLRDIGEARRTIDQVIAGALDEIAPGTPVASGATSPARPLWKRALPWVMGVGGMAGVWLASRPPAAPAQPVTRTIIELPDGLSLVRRDRAVALSPDGTQLAVVLTDARNQSQLYLRALGRLEMRALGNTDGATYPFWSPDGRALGFFAGGQLKRLDLPDGLVRSMAPAMFARGGTWGTDEKAVFAASDQTGIRGRLFRASMATPGAAAPVGPDPTDTLVMRLPLFLPSGGVVFERYDRVQPGKAELLHLDLNSGETRPIGGPLGEVHYIAPGSLASLGSSILSVRTFDLSSASLSGAPAVLASGVVSDELRGTGHVSFARDQGSFVYLQAPPTPLRQVTWMDAEGRPSAAIGEPARIAFVSVSPEGRHALLGIDNQDGAFRPQMWMMDLSTGLRSPFTGPQDGGVVVAWSPDGRRVAYSGRDGRMVVRPTDGGTDRVVAGDPAFNYSPYSWTPDGKSVLVAIYRGLRGTDLAVMSADGTGEPRFLLESPAAEREGRISPDGRWLAYLSNESGRDELFLTPYTTPGPRWPLTTTGVTSFSWTSAREMTYLGIDDRARRVAWEVRGDRVEVAPVRPALGGRDLRDFEGSSQPVAGRYLVAVPLPGQALRPSLVLVTNWQSEMRAQAR
jgi:Tol biopolymer transport system component/predicted Ser/Thr protein kinase